MLGLAKRAQAKTKRLPAITWHFTAVAQEKRGHTATDKVGESGTKCGSFKALGGKEAARAIGWEVRLNLALAERYQTIRFEDVERILQKNEKCGLG